MAAESEYLDAVMRFLNEEEEALTEYVTNGSIEGFPQYREALGEIRGYRRVRDKLRDIEQKFLAE